MKIREFENIKEFAKDRKLNRIIYSTMSLEEKAQLKKYIYGLNERRNRKDFIWEYLNEPMETDYYISVNIIMSSYDRSDK